MNYVYDILVNFKYPLIDFFDWNKDDNIENIKKIPLYKISSSDLCKFKYYKFKIKDISNIEKMTKLFNNKNKVYNAAIYTDGNEAVVVNYSIDGMSIAKSFLLLDEENEILKNASLLPLSKIEYRVICKDIVKHFYTRKQLQITNFLVDKISKIDDINELRYLSYECLEKTEKISKEEIVECIKAKWEDKYYKIYDFFNSPSMNKN